MTSRYVVLTACFVTLAASIACSATDEGRRAVPDASLSDGSLSDAESAGPDAAGDGAQTSDGGAFADAPTVRIARAGGTPISHFAFGNNYYDWVDWSNSGTTALGGTEVPVAALRLNILVANNNNTDMDYPQLFDDAQIDKYIQYCRAIGAEPIMEVPLLGNNVDAGPTSAEGAAAMVTYVNGTKGYGVKYWTIGDEADNYTSATCGVVGPQNVGCGPNNPIKTAADYCAVFKSYGAAMRAANDAADSGVTLQLLGPELAGAYYSGNDWLTPFLDGCKDDVDIVTIHAYGFSGPQDSVAGALNGVSSFRSLFSNIRQIVAAHARPGTPFGITETAISWDWDRSAYPAASLLAAPGTFYSAIWDADLMGAALEARLWTLAFWDLAEPVGTTSVFGLLHTDSTVAPPSYAPTPEYYAQQLVTTSFSGTTVVPSGVPGGFSVYASYDPAKAATAVLVINKTDTAAPLSLAVDSLPPRLMTFGPLSISLVTIPDDGDAGTHVVEYNGDLADAGLGPKTLR